MNFLPDEVAMLWVLRRGALFALLLAVGLTGRAAGEDAALHARIDKLIEANAGIFYENCIRGTSAVRGRRCLAV